MTCLFHGQDIVNRADLNMGPCGFNYNNVLVSPISRQNVFDAACRIDFVTCQIVSLTFRLQKQFEGEVEIITKQLTHIILKSFYL